MTIRMRKRSNFYGEGRGCFEFLDPNTKRVLVKRFAKSGMIRFIVFVGDTVAGILDCHYDWHGVFGMLTQQFFTPVDGVTIEWIEE